MREYPKKAVVPLCRLKEREKDSMERKEAHRNKIRVSGNPRESNQLLLNKSRKKVLQNRQWPLERKKEISIGFFGFQKRN